MENELRQRVLTPTKCAEMDDFEEFEKKVDEITNAINALNTNTLSSHDLKNILEEPRTVTNRKPNVLNSTISRKETHKGNSIRNMTEETMSQESFMREIEEDANRRCRERQERYQCCDGIKSKAGLAFREGNYEKALLLYNQALDLRRDSSMLFLNRAVTFLRLGLFTKACEDCDSALKLKDALKTHLIKSRALFEKGDIEASDASLSYARVTFPNQLQTIEDYEAEWKTQ